MNHGGAADAGLLAVGAIGAVLVLVTLLDLFITIFNYDGFTFLSARFHHLMWRAMRTSSNVLPSRARGAALSLGAASMLPATIALWLGLEVVGFAMMFLPGVAANDFLLEHHLQMASGTAFYASAGAISSMVFGDVEPRTSLYQALMDVETIVGISTMTLALTYVLTTLNVLSHIDRLHGRVRRHAQDPERPSSVLEQHFRWPGASHLPDLLQSLTEDLDSYDQGLRRYPIVYYFHTRRIERSIPRVFSALGELIALARWGLPPSEPLTDDPMLRALCRGYVSTVERMQRSFCDDPYEEAPPPLGPNEFWAARRGQRRDDGVAEFNDLESRARRSAGLSDAPSVGGGGEWGADRGEHAEDTYRRYREWLPFHQRRQAFVETVAHSLGYELRDSAAQEPSVA